MKNFKKFINENLGYSNETEKLTNYVINYKNFIKYNTNIIKNFTFNI